MSWHVNDVYHSPEKFGLTIVGMLDDPQSSYSFDDTVVWQSTDSRKLYYGQDSGCSCPSSFEGQGIEDLTEITDETWNDFFAATRGRVRTGYGNRRDESFYDQVDATDLLAKVSMLMGEQYE